MNADNVNKIICKAYSKGLDDGLAIARSHWIPLKYNDDEKVTHTNFPDELDGSWVLVTDGKTISVERIKKDIPDDHFFPSGRWFELNDVIAWMPIPKPYEKEGEQNDRQ